MNLKEFLVKNREIAQLAYGVILIILIPLLITYNTVFIIKKYNSSLDVSLQRHALSIGRAISFYLKDSLTDAEKLQKKIEALSAKNVELEEISILVPEGDNFKVLASTKTESIDQVFDFYYYRLAWMQPDNDGLSTDSMMLAATVGDKNLSPDSDSGGRFWLVALPIGGDNGHKQALLTLKLSSEIIDNLTNYNRNASIYLLIGTVFVIILFLLIAVRLWDYALLYRKIKELDQMKDDLISIASHELRTPVTGIKGHVSMMLDGTFGEINDQVKKSLKIVSGAADRLAVLVNDLLDVSRIEQGRIKINPQPADVNPIISGLINELKVQADEKKLALIYEQNGGASPLINIDVDRFKQVMINLIGNAIKYTQTGSVEISVAEKVKGMLEIRIKDTGIGMSSNQRTRLFEKFYRVQSDKTKNITGTGLGLWITKQLAELMKGTITVDSIENVGTQVSLEFPIIKN